MMAETRLAELVTSYGNAGGAGPRADALAACAVGVEALFLTPGL